MTDKHLNKNNPVVLSSTSEDTNESHNDTSLDDSDEDVNEENVVLEISPDKRYYLSTYFCCTNSVYFS